MKSLSAYIVLVIATGFYSLNSKASSLFDEGVKAHNEEKYVLAIEKFQAEIDSIPENVAAYYNLGLSALGAEEYGKAIWAFEKVLKFKPSDSETKEKLAETTLLLGQPYEWQPTINGFQASLYSISSNTWAVLAIAASVLLCISIIVFKRRTGMNSKRSMLLLGFFSGIMLVAGTTLAYLGKDYSTQTHYAVITKKTVPVFASDTITALSNISEGTRVSITAVMDDRFEIIAPNGQIGFLKLEDVSPI